MLSESAGCLGLQFKEELMAAMGLNTEEEGSPMAFFRRGYKVSSPPSSSHCVGRGGMPSGPSTNIPAPRDWNMP